MRRFLLAAACALPLGCTSGMSGARPDTSEQLNADQSFAHASNGEIILGPSYIDEVVEGQRDVAGNIHVDPTTPPRL